MKKELEWGFYLLSLSMFLYGAFIGMKGDYWGFVWMVIGYILLHTSSYTIKRIYRVERDSFVGE